MNPYLGLIWTWAIAAYLLYNCYYGIRYPDKYMKASWTLKPWRGVPKELAGASVGAAMSMIGGLVFFAGGLVILHSLVTKSSSPCAVTTIRSSTNS